MYLSTEALLFGSPHDLATIQDIIMMKCKKKMNIKDGFFSLYTLATPGQVRLLSTGTHNVQPWVIKVTVNRFLFLINKLHFNEMMSLHSVTLF